MATQPDKKSRPKLKEASNLSAKAYQEIKNLILRTEILPGQKLHHQELSEHLRVSRTPVREALSRLVQEGYVSLLPNRGFICKEIGMQEAEELYDLREALEAFCIEKAIANLEPGGLERLQQKIDLYGQDTSKRFTRERLLYDQDIHLEIAQIAGSKSLVRTLSQVFERIVLKRRTDALYDGSRGISAHQEHLRILTAMRKRNVQDAVRLIRSHIQNGKKNVLSDLKQRAAIRGLHMLQRAV